MSNAKYAFSNRGSFVLNLISISQLDLRIQKIDHAWPVTAPKPAPTAPVPINRNASNTKIHVNPNFVSKTVSANWYRSPGPDLSCLAGERENAARGGGDREDACRAAEEGGGVDQAEAVAARHGDPKG